MVSVQGLDKRYYYGGYGSGYGYRRSRFSSWGRWVLLGIIIFAALFFFLACTCFARRRRRKGSKPVYGTGWMAPTGGKWGVNNNNTQQYPMNNTGYNQGGYGQDYNQNQGGYNQGYNQGGYNAPPAYGHQPQQQYDGYYGGQQQYNGVQQPPNTYNRDAPVGDVAPPPGPPPGK